MEMVEWSCEDGCQDAAAVLRPVLLLPVEGVLLALSGCGKPSPLWVDCQEPAAGAEGVPLEVAGAQ